MFDESILIINYYVSIIDVNLLGLYYVNDSKHFDIYNCILTTLFNMLNGANNPFYITAIKILIKRYINICKGYESRGMNMPIYETLMWTNMIEIFEKHEKFLFNN